MGKKLFLICITILIGIACYSQDIIVRTNGDVIKCKIEKEDDNTVYFKIRQNNHEVSTNLKKSQISSIKYFNEEEQLPVKYDNFSLGIGLGLDYGGIGFNILGYPQKKIGLFGGLGYALSGVGVNAGAKFRFVPDATQSKASAYGLIMYGYNTAIIIKNEPDLEKLFYGPTIGFGFDYKSHPNKTGYWSFALLVPIRGTNVGDYIDDLEQNENIKFETGLMPIAISMGYRIILN